MRVRTELWTRWGRVLSYLAEEADTIPLQHATMLAKGVSGQLTRTAEGLTQQVLYRTCCRGASLGLRPQRLAHVNGILLLG